MGNDLEELVAAINNSDINCFSITDHNIFPAEMFRKISKEINKDKVFFPGIELNLIISDEEKSEHNLTTKANYFHAVVIFNSEENYEEIEKCFAEALEYENSEKYAKDRDWKNISKDFGNKKIDIVKLQLKLAKFDYLFIPHENKEKGLTKYLGNESTQNQEYKKRLFYYNSMGLDGRINKNQEINKHVKHKIYKEIASFTFTDREKFTSKWTWIQFDKTFEGLLIAITDPEYRIFSSTEHLNSPQKNVDEYIAKISFNQKNNENAKERTEIFLHPGYNAIIGTRGSGKTTLAKISAKNDIHDKITDIEYFSDSNIVKIFGESEIAYYRQGEFQTYYEKENRPDTIKFLKNKQDNLYDKLKLNNEELEKKISVISTEISKLCDDFFQINDEDKISVLEENKYIEQEDTLEINNINIDSDKHFQNKERVENVRSTIEIIKESRNKININYSEELSEYKVNNITEELRELDSIISDMDRVINSIYQKVKNIHLKNKEREKYIEFFSQSNRDVSKEINLENQELKEYKERKIKILIETYNFRYQMYKKFMSIDTLIKNSDKCEERQEFNIGNDSYIIEIGKSNIESLNKIFELQNLRIPIQKFIEMIALDKIDNIKSHLDGRKYKNINTKKEIIKRITEEIKKSVSMTEEDFKIRLIKNNKNFSELSPGERVDALLDVIFEKDIKENSYKLIIFDQPEDNLDVSTLKNKLISRIRDMKLKQQIIVVSHSAPLVVNGDANNIIISQFNNEKNIFEYRNGGMCYENTREAVVDILDGGEQYMKERFSKYAFKYKEIK